MNKRILQVLKKLQEAGRKSSDIISSKAHQVNSAEFVLNGLSYTLAESLYHLFPGVFTPYRISWEDDTSHWFLMLPDGEIVETVASDGGKLSSLEEYEMAQRAAFVTKTPSKRTRTLVERAGLSLTENITNRTSLLYENPQDQESLDNEEKLRRKHKFTTKLLSAYETAVAKIIVYCVGETPFPLGINKTIDILKGTKSAFITESKLDELAMFGVLSPFSAKYLKGILEKLIDKKFLQIIDVSKYQNIPTIEITLKGKELLRSSSCHDLGIIFQDTEDNDSVTELDPQEEELFKKLMIVRKDISQREKSQPHKICRATVLRRIAKSKPANEQELLSIKGIGEKFIHNYGKTFLHEIELFNQEG